MQRFFARFSGISLLLSLLLLLIPALGSSLHAQTTVRNLIVQPVDESALTTLGGNVHPLAVAQNDLGAAPVSQPLSHVRLVLRRSTAQETALDKYLASLQDKNSPSYHQWLTPAQFGKLYGPSDSDMEKLTGWLQGHGFSIDELGSGRTHIAFSGSVAQVQQAFHLSIHSYRANGVDFVANTSDPKIPSAFAAVVSGVAHLNTVPLKPMHVRGAGAKYDPATHRMSPQSTGGRLRPDLNEQDNSGNNYLLAVPGDVATIYDTPNSTFNANFSGGTTYDGTGAIIGIAGQSAIQTSIVANYRTLFIGDSKVPTVLNPNNVGDVSGDDLESYLDNEVAGSMAPGASIYFYTEPSTAGGVFQAADDAIAANQVDILTVSYGDCESDQGNADNQVINAEWQQAAAQGITVVVSTGDTGSAGCDVATDSNGNSYTQASGGLAVNGLGSTPYNIAVGGTDYDVLAKNFGTYVNTPSNGGSQSSFFRTAKNYIPESTWNDSTLNNTTISQNVPLTSSASFASSANIAGGAGGKSNCAVQTASGSGNGYVSPSACVSGYAKPSWQTGAGVPNDGVRDIPDVSLLSGDGFYGALWATCDTYPDGSGGQYDCSVASGSFEVDSVGGTSAATPAFASILALVRQKTGGRLGQAAQTLYSLSNGSSSGSIFHDVTTGNNSVPCSQSTTNATSCVANAAGNFYETGYDTNAGYDLATGLGSVDVTALVNGWTAAALITPTVQLATASSSITVGTSPSITATVTGSGATPTGTVVFSTGSYTSPVQELISGSVSFSLPAADLSIGDNTITATYSGDLVYAGATSTIAVNVATGVATASVSVTASSASIAADQPLTVSSTITGTSGVPTGTVTFSSGTYTSPVQPLSAGTATATIPGSAFTTAGTTTITAAYSGDATYATASGTATVTVTAAPVNTFTLAATPAAVTVAAGATTGNTAAITITPSAGYAPSLSFTCTLTTPASGSNASYYPACTVPAAMVASGSATGTATATFSSTARSTTTALATPQEKRPNHWYTAIGGATLACVLFFGVPARRRSWKSMLALLVFLVAMAGVGCGGSSSNNNTPVTTGTTAGPYVFTITGTDSANSTITGTTTVTLTVN